MKEKPLEAYLITPVPKEEYRHWVDPRFTYKRTLTTKPIRSIWDKISSLYWRINFEVIGAKLVLVLEPRA